MSENVEPLAPDVLAVLAQANPVKDLPRPTRDRVWKAVEARLAMVPGAYGGEQGPAVPVRSRVPLSALITNNPWTAVITALLLGGAVGASLPGRRDAPSVTASSSFAVAASSVAAPPPAPWTEIVAATPSAATVAPTVSHPPVSSARNTGQELAAESAILDLARTSIARGEADHALAAVERHAATFPHGMLREEREALGVKALVLAGRGDDARARMARFRARYPESLFLPALESALRSIP